MKLYHFTAAEYVDSIATTGLWKGEVPITRFHVENAVWLTSDQQPNGHGLTDGREVTVLEKQVLGAPADQVLRFPDKRAVRLTIKIPRGDRALVPWTTWGKKRLAPEWYDCLDRTGGRKSRTWYLYRGTIPAQWVMVAENLRTGESIAFQSIASHLQQPAHAETQGA